MAVLSALVLSPQGLIISFLLLLLAYILIPYYTTYAALRKVPGPLSCKFSNLWIALSSRSGQRYRYVDEAHKRYGKVVRLGHNHVSIASETALPIVYGHGNGFLKAHFYEAFVSGVPGVFNTRDRIEHTRKRKLIAHAFSPRAVVAFEQHMAANIRRLMQQLDRICQTADASGYATVDVMPWCSYLAFDIIGDLVFGKPFGMVDRGRDECECQLTPDGDVQYTSAVETLNRRGEVSSTLGWMPGLRLLRHLDPFLTKGLQSVSNLHGMAVAAVDGRQAHEKHDRTDILKLLIEGKDAQGNPMGRSELISEALTQLIAGSDTISNTLCACIYWILDGERRQPGQIISKLVKELDGVMQDDHTAIGDWTKVQHLPFLRRCIDEAMRLHSTSAIGLPRIVTQPEGVSFEDYYFPQGTILSVPSYTIHHDAEIWGDDVEEFKPDRWRCLTERQKMAFNPFSFGPRACVGQNIARMELSIILATFFHRYEAVLCQDELRSHEGFSKKPEGCMIGLRRRA